MSPQVRFPSEVRRELLEQHRGLRVLIQDATVRAQGVISGAAHPGDLDEVTGELKAALLAHNATEEAALSPLLIGVDAFGPERVERLLQHHHDEHQDLLQTIDGAASAADASARARALLATLDRLIAHMDGEESEELSSHVLRDDVVSIDAAGG